MTTRVNRWRPLIEFLLVFINDTSGDVVIMHKAGFIEEPGLDRTFGYYRILGLFQSQHGHTSRRSKRSWGEASLRVTGSTIKRISALTSAWAESVLAFTARRRGQKTCTAVKKWLRELWPCCVFTTKARPHSWKIWEVWYLCGSSERNEERNSGIKGKHFCSTVCSHVKAFRH